MTKLGTQLQFLPSDGIMEFSRQEYWSELPCPSPGDAKAFDYVDHKKLWKFLKEMGIPDHLTCLLRNLYAGQEALGTAERGTADWFQIRKGVPQGYILSPCLLNFDVLCI